MPRIRPVEPRDAEALFDLVASFPAPTRRGREAYASALSLKLSDPTSYTAAALDGDEDERVLAGYVAGCCHVTFYAAGWTAWVDEIFVRPDRRGQGIGRMLMTAFESWALSRDCKLVALATAGAGPFYEHLGYASKAGYYKKYLSPSGR
jgi:GNAT superfamily N-acetyltransferase